jgi:copper chaperone CopZ
MNSNIYVHMLTGRLRVKVPEVKRASREASRLEATLVAVEGIDHAQANPTTGNVLVIFDPATLTHERILELIQAAGYLKVHPQPYPKDGSLERVANLVVRELVKIAAQAALERLIFTLI